MNRHPSAWRIHALATACLLGGLAGCGSSGSDDPSPAPDTALTLSGTVSNGAALANRTVDARCATGTGSATSGSDGRYSLSIEGGALPCLLQTTTADGGDPLHSVARGTGRSATAHLTPFTELVVASLAGIATSDYHAAFGATTASAVTADSVAAATTRATPVIASGGVDTAALGSVLTSTVSNAPLATFSAALAGAGLTLPALSLATAQGSPNNPAPTSSVKLPPELLLKPKAATCDALRSGTYRVADPHFATADEPDQSYLITLDASTLGIVDLRDDTTDTLVPTGECRFTNAEGELDLVVSQAGFMVFRYLVDGTTDHRVGLAMLEQTHHTVADMQGTWNAAGINRETGDSALNVRYDFNPLSAVVIAADGTVTAPSTTDSIKIQPHPSLPGFDMVDTTAGETSRLYALRSGGGELMLLVLSDEGSFELFTPQRPLPLPAAGDLNDNWTVSMNTSAVSVNSLSVGSFTIQSVDSVTKSWTRVDNNTGVINTFFGDDPAVGFQHRPAATSPINGGGTVNVLELTGLRLRGTGLNMSWVPLGGSPSQPGTLNISVTQP